MDDNNLNHLIGERDAEKWVDGFLTVVPDADRDLMHTWFACAIESGRMTVQGEHEQDGEDAGVVGDSGKAADVRGADRHPKGGWIVTYHPDSVLVEKVEAAIREADYEWPTKQTDVRAYYRRLTEAALSVACPLVAGVIADRLDETEEVHWFDAPAEFVRSEFVDGEA